MKKFAFIMVVASLISLPTSGLTQPQWQLQTTLSGLSSVKAVSREVAWACAYGGPVYRTTNGGRNWLQRSSATNAEFLNTIEALDSTTAFVGGGGQNGEGGNVKIYRTTNGGVSWDAVYTAIGPDSWWIGIHFFDTLNGIAISEPPTAGGPFLIVKTTDGGTIWTPIANPPTDKGDEGIWFNCFFFYDNLHGWFGTGGAQGARVIRTTDGGNTWNGFETGITGAAGVLSVSFVSPMIGIGTIFSNNRYLLRRTTDGGQTWAPVANLPVANFAGLEATTAISTSGLNQLWLQGVGAGPTFRLFMLSSLDGGVTWQQQTTASISQSSATRMSAVSFGASSDSVRAWAVINFGEVLTYLNRIGQGTAVEEQTSLPTSYSLSQNFPNPFNPSTTISYSIPTPQSVKLKIYDVLGQEVATLVNERKNAGNYQVSFEANTLTSGIYLYRLEAGDFVQIKKMILVR